MRVTAHPPHEPVIPPTDPVKELRLRAWARANYVPVSGRSSSWHPLVLDEMSRRDAEQIRESSYTPQSAEALLSTQQVLPMGGGFVPLAPDDVLMVSPGPIAHPPHLKLAQPHVLRNQEYVVQSTHREFYDARSPS